MAQPSQPPAGVQLSEDMHRLSLDQALVDFEIANARVVDLTQRLIECQAELRSLRTEHEALRLEHAQLSSRHEQMKSSSAFRTAQKIWGIRNAIGV